MELEFSNRGEEIARTLFEAHLSSIRTQHSYHCACDRCRFNFGAPGNWLKVQTDTSCGGEVISSPLAWAWTGPIGAEGRYEPDPWLLMQELERILGPELDVPMDQRCGMHVHVGARDLSARQLGRLYELTEHHEATLFRLACGRQTQHRGYLNNFSYCRPLSAFNNRLELKALEKAKTAAVRSSVIAKQKYVAANLMPLDNLGTVEFRLFEATRSARRMRLYTKLSVALVERAKRPRAPMGKPLHLGEEGDDSTLEVFLEDLEHGAPMLVDDAFKEDVLWQWGRSPARWQQRIMLPPLPHFDRNNRPTINPDQAVYCSDGHGHTIMLEGEDPDVEDAYLRPPSFDPVPDSYEEAYDRDDDDVSVDPDVDPTRFPSWTDEAIATELTHRREALRERLQQIHDGEFRATYAERGVSS